MAIVTGIICAGLRALGKGRGRACVPCARKSSAVVGHQRFARHIEAGAAVEERQFDQRCGGRNDTADLAQQRDGGGQGAASGKKIVHHHHALAGLEFLSGIPGTVGGALAMNAGAYGGELAQVLVWAEAVDRAGRIFTVTPQELGLTYRHSDAPADWIFTSARLKASPGDQIAIARRIHEIDSARTESQPRSRTGGSTFVNPPGHKAWELIDRAGCRGLKIGGAQVSEKHTNFLINTGDATAADIEALGEEVRRRVFEQSGVRLEWEIRRIGEML